jgi:hypothetical protein
METCTVNAIIRSFVGPLVQYKEKTTYNSMDNVFHPGIDNRPPLFRLVQRRRMHPYRQRVILLNKSQSFEFSIQKPWEERIKTTPTPGHIRLLSSGNGLEFVFQKYWYSDMTLTQWISGIAQLRQDVCDNPVARMIYPVGVADTLLTIFTDNQRKRWLARKVLQKWNHILWMKRTQCNIDMIDMQPIADKDALFMTDTHQKQIFRFHRRDVYNNLLANICMSDEMLPYPRIPTNPWTNSPLTLAQIISICSQLIADYAKRDRCPPVLFAAFCAARFNLQRFATENSSLLSQHAIVSYFKDLTSENMEAVYETITQLLSDAQLEHSPTAIRRWLRQTPQTPLHKEWLQMVNDYTLYMNLHVQVRQSWVNLAAIFRDVRGLYQRTTRSLPVSNRIRVIQNLPTGLVAPTPNVPAPTFSSLLNMSMSLVEGTTETMDLDSALMLIQQSLFR